MFASYLNYLVKLIKICFSSFIQLVYPLEKAFHSKLFEKSMAFGNLSKKGGYLEDPKLKIKAM